MTETIISSNTTVTNGDGLDMLAGDTAYVETGVILASSKEFGDGIYANSSVNVQVDGSVYGDLGVADLGGNLYIGKNGSVIGAEASGIERIGSANITNFGTIEGVAGGITFANGASSDVLSLFNYGTISSDTGNSLFGGPESDKIINNGLIRGDMTLGSAGSTLDSSLGQIYGAITAGGGSNSIIAGTNGGTVTGATGNDNLQANRTAIAATDHSQFTLDGAGGTNALYGGGAFNTFDAGDSAGGHNQIHGGQSQMSDVVGYVNNTLDFSKTPSGKSVYVDLLSGHNAYLYAGASHTGALTFEDSIQNVPNVIGSTGGDLIRADNGTDVIQGGTGADILYAGTGADTFVYKGYADSNTPSGYDSISGFVTGKDKLDLSALNSDPSHLTILNGTNSVTLYLEKTPGTFAAATDLAISFQGAHAIAASDVIF